MSFVMTEFPQFIFVQLLDKCSPTEAPPGGKKITKNDQNHLISMNFQSWYKLSFKKYK